MANPQQLTPEKRIRLLVFLGVVSFMVGSPAFTQFGGYGITPLQRYWRMYAGIGVHTCQVSFVARTENGEVPVDRAAALGHASMFRARKSERNLEGVKAIRAQAAVLCDRLQVRDLRADARCGSYRGWIPAMAGEENLCPLPRSRRRRAR